MIVFVLEGKAEEKIADTVSKLYFNDRRGDIRYCFEDNIYTLYGYIKKKYADFSDMKDAVDFISVLKERHPDSDLNEIESTSDIEAIYLFFDYDFQQVLELHRRNPDRTLTELLNEDNRNIQEMLDFFDEETEMGKLYINFPMVESLYYTKELPDERYRFYSITLDGCKTFKKDVSDFTHYKGHHGIILQNNANPDMVRRNWELLKEQNVRKANYVCNGSYSIPLVKQDISQDRIFKAQTGGYNKTHEIGILNSFPLFLYEYFK